MVESKDTAQNWGFTPLHTHRKPRTRLKKSRELLPHTDLCWGQGYHMLFEAGCMVFHQSERSVTAVC